jgi:hypothetical protein
VSRSTEDLLSELARDLAPVRPIPRLTAVALGLLGTWGVGVVLFWLVAGAWPQLAQPGGLADPVFAAIFAALGAAGLGGTLATLARAVPGRERLARGGAWTLALGLSVATAVALLGWAFGEAGSPATPLHTATCVVRSAVLGVAPALLGFAWLARAWEPRPAIGAWAASLGAAALGGCAVHASCVTGDGLHMLIGHALGPAAVALAVGWRGRRWLGRRALPA